MSDFLQDSGVRENSIGRDNRKSDSPSGKGSETLAPMENFYYSNLFDDNRLYSIHAAVRHDTNPFLQYLNVSQGSLMKRTAAGSEVMLLEADQSILTPKFSLVKVHVNSFRAEFEIPSGCYYSIDCNDDDFEGNNFKITRGLEPICDMSAKVDEYEGRVFIRLKEPLKNPKAPYKLWTADESKDWNIGLRPVDFSKPDLYRLECENIDRKSIKISDGKISFSLFSKPENNICKVRFFDEEFEVPIKAEGKQTEIAGVNLRQNMWAFPISGEWRQSLEKSGIRYEELSVSDYADDIIKFTGDGKIGRSGENFIYSAPLTERTETVTIKGLEFSARKRKQKQNERFSGCGFWIELKEDDSLKSESFSNVDVFFNENVDYLTDKPQKDCKDQRRFRIGYVDRENSAMEICLFTDGKPVPVGNTAPKKLYAVIDTNQIQKQINALLTLRSKPVREQRNLLKLFEREDCVRWPAVSVNKIKADDWRVLSRNPDSDGVEEQKEFVEKALSTPDFAFLDGPPGSGKTTTILEIILQMIVQGKKVLFAASTNAAVDNILERIEKLPSELQDQVFAVRLGTRQSDSVKQFSKPEKIDDGAWHEIVRRANLVCGTIIGILQHPDFKFDRSQPAFPIYDMLIIDEASKTTFQDFLIPSLFAKKWILSGDLMQLTPYVEQGTIAASIEEIPDFSEGMQFVISVMLWTKTKDAESVLSQIKLAIPVSANTVNEAEKLLPGETKKREIYKWNFAILANKESDCPNSVSFEEFKAAAPKAALVYGSDVLFVDESIYKQVVPLLPKKFFQFRAKEDYELSRKFIQAAEWKNIGKISVERDYCDSFEKLYKKVDMHIKEKSFANEITWRLSRIHELFWSNEKEQVEKYKKQIEEIYAEYEKEKVKRHIDAINGIALPSVMQLLKSGMDEEVVKNIYKTTLNGGFVQTDFEARHTMLEYQHRMHPEISKFSRENIYEGKALQDGREMSDSRNWEYKCYESHAVWLDVEPQKDYRNENPAECKKIGKEVEEFAEWTEKNPKKADNADGKSPNWSVAVLTYYIKQERMLKQKMREIFGGKEKSRYVDDKKHIEVMIYTVDKFQGMEADIVFLSMVKSGKGPLGFMDSMNRFNVAITRAKYQRVVVGDKSYFESCKSELLKNFLEECQSSQ